MDTATYDAARDWLYPASPTPPPPPLVVVSEVKEKAKDNDKDHSELDLAEWQHIVDEVFAENDARQTWDPTQLDWNCVINLTGRHVCVAPGFVKPPLPQDAIDRILMGPGKQSIDRYVTTSFKKDDGTEATVSVPIQRGLVINPEHRDDVLLCTEEQVHLILAAYAANCQLCVTLLQVQSIPSSAPTDIVDHLTVVSMPVIDMRLPEEIVDPPALDPILEQNESQLLDELEEDGDERMPAAT